MKVKARSATKRSRSATSRTASTSTSKEDDDPQGQGEGAPPRHFNFDLLAVELRHEILKKLKTPFLEDVCALVSTSWRGIVNDIVAQRIIKAGSIPAHVLGEIRRRFLPEDVVNLLRVFETSHLRKEFNLTSIQVNDDCLGRKYGMIQKIFSSGCRACNCGSFDKCVARCIHIMHALDLVVLQGSKKLEFYHLSDLERLEGNRCNRSFEPYVARCEANSSLKLDTTTSISVFRDQILMEEKAKTLLLIRVAEVDHEEKTLEVERLRRIFLPIWSLSLLLLEDRFFVQYTTGFVGMWDRTRDSLSMSAVNPGMQVEPHACRLFRVGELVFIRSMPTHDRMCTWNFLHWDAASDAEKMDIFPVQMATWVTGRYLKLEPTWECTEVFYMELWHNNFFVVHCQVQSLVTQGKTENRLMIRRTVRHPQPADFYECTLYDPQSDFFEPFEPPQRAPLDGCMLPLFVPLGISPWLLEPGIKDPAPVADVISIYWPIRPVDKRQFKSLEKYERLQVFRTRIANLPLPLKSKS